MTAAAQALSEEGLTPLQIAVRLDTQDNKVRALLQNAHSRDREAATKGKLVIPFAIAEQLQADADRRGTTAARLAARVLEAVIADGLVDAVLDDAPEVSANG